MCALWVRFVCMCIHVWVSVSNVLADRKSYLPEQRVKLYMYQLCKSIYHMHRNGIFHRDVKPENILVKVSVSEFKGRHIWQSEEFWMLNLSSHRLHGSFPLPPSPPSPPSHPLSPTIPTLSPPPSPPSPPSLSFTPSSSRTMCWSWQTLDHVRASIPNIPSQNTSLQDGRLC